MIHGSGGSTKISKGEKFALAEDDVEELMFIHSSDEESEEDSEENKLEGNNE